MNKFKQIAAGLALACASSIGTAGVIDLTSAPLSLSGTLEGTTNGYTISGLPTDPIPGESLYGDPKSDCISMSGLACDFDGIGISDDEIGSNNVTESVKIVFDYAVTFVYASFLDLFGSEQVTITNGAGNSVTIGSNLDNNDLGYQSALVGLVGKVFTFTADTDTDFWHAGNNDYSLASITAFDRGQGEGDVPVPAAIWLFGSALLGFMGFSRKKSV